MPSYEITFARSARRELESLDSTIVRRVFSRIEALAENPNPRGAIKLKGSKNLWRLRVGDFRILYEIDNRAQTVDIVAIGDRKDVYRSS